MAEGVMLVAKFSADVSEFVDSVKDVVTAAHDAADAIQQMASAGGSGGGGFGALASGAKDFGGALVEAGKGMMDMVFEAQMMIDVLKQVGEALFGTAAAAQATKQEFTDSMKGDVTAANELYDAIEALATAKGLDTDALEKVGGYLLAIGTDAKNVVPELDAISGAVAKVGGGADMIQNIVTALNKMQDSGKVTTQAITKLQDTGVDAWQALAAGFGTTVPDAMKKVASGTMNSTDAVNALVAGFKKLDGANTEVSTLGGSWTKLTDQLGGLAAKVFGPLIDAVTVVLGLIGKLIDVVGGLGPAIANAFGIKTTGQIDSQSQAIKDWATSSGTATQAADTFNAANNQTAGALTKTTAAAATATTATTTSTTATTAHTAAVTAQGTVIAGTTERFAPLAAGTKAVDIATLSAAGSAGTYSWTLGSAAQAYQVSATKAAAFAQQTADITAKLQAGAAAADKASTSFGDVIPNSLQDQINHAGDGLGTLAVHFTKTGDAANDGSKQIDSATQAMNSNIAFFAQQTGVSFDKAKQEVGDYAKYTQQSMSDAAKALAGPQNTSAPGVKDWVQNAQDLLSAFLQKVQDIMGKVGQLLSSVGGSLPSSVGSTPSFASGVQNYTGMAIVGEEGPELVSLNGGSVYPLTGTGGANLANIGGVSGGGTGPVSIVVALDSQVLAQAVFPQLSSSIRMAVGRRM